MHQPLIISARLEEPTQQALTDLRYRFFPSNRYVLPAHLTLFHAIPYTLLKDVAQLLREATQQRAPQVQLSGLRFLGRGFAVAVDAPVLVRFHAQVRSALADELTPQDSRPLKPHITLQNKVDPEQARLDMAAAHQAFEPSACSVVSLCLWQYQGGPWSLLEAYPFSVGP